MKLEQAKKLKVGDTVWYPADRGEPRGQGVVIHVGKKEQEHALLEEKFLWVTLEGEKGVWPSNRLSK